jgi:hypothetical protein
MFSMKAFALLFVFCFAVGSVLAQLDPADIVILYDQNTLIATSGNLTGWENSAPGALGSGDLVAGATAPTLGNCGSSNGVLFNGASSLVGSLSSPISVTASSSVVVVVVAQNNGGGAGRKGVLSTSGEATVPWSEASVGPGAFVSGAEYYEDAADATTANVAATSGLDVGDYTAVGFAYIPDASTTADDFSTINGATVQFFTGTPATVAVSNAFAAINVGWRAAGADANQYFEGCISYIAVYVTPDSVDPADVALTVLALSERFTTGASTPGNSTTVPSPSPLSRTTTTGSRTTTTGRRTTTTGRRSTTGRRTSTTGVSAASLPVAAPVTIFFAVLVSAFLFFML